MKTVQLVFILLGYLVFQILFVGSGGAEDPIIFPTFDVPDFEFIDLSSGCGGFTDCIEYVGAVIYNIGLGIIFLILFLIELITFVFDLFALIVEINFTGFNGAPWWVNLMFTVPLGAIIALLIYRMARSGETDD